jgi:serine protease
MVVWAVAGDSQPSGGRAGSGSLAIVAAALLAAPASAAAPPNGPPEPSRPPASEEAIVLVRAPQDPGGGGVAAARGRLRDAVSAADLEPERVVAEIGAASVDLPPGQSVGELRQELDAQRGVVAVEPNLRLEPRVVPSDPAYAARDPNAPGGDTYQWNLRKSRFERAWENSRGAHAKVAVIDTGADAAHPDLGPRIEASFDKDDTLLHGGPERDESGHGSHVSGMACGQSGNGYGIVGAGYRCDLLVYKTDLTLASISESVVDATDRNVDVINMSFGGEGQSKALEQAVRRAVKRDVVMIAAAANEDTTDQGIPAAYLQPPGSGPDIREGTGLVVTAAQHDGAPAWFGPGKGTGISMAAYGAAGPGHRGIFSSFPAEITELETIDLCTFCRGDFQGDDRFAYLEGTSMATPQVSGAAALIRHRQPQMAAARVVRLLKRHASREGGFTPTLGWGILNANRALRAALK